MHQKSLKALFHTPLQLICVFPPVFQYTITQEVHTCFQETKLTQYKQMFLEKGCDGLEVIAAIMDDKLDEIRLNLPNHRTKILLMVSSFRKKVLVEMPSNSLVIQRKVCYELLLLLCFAYLTYDGKCVTDWYAVLYNTRQHTKQLCTLTHHFKHK